MTSAVLFEEGNRCSTDIKRIGETNYQYLSRSDRPGTDVIRSRLSSWFSLLPENKKSSFSARLKAENNFAGTFYELFLLGLFTSMGFTVEVEPVMQENEKLPDFLLRKEKSQIIVEATANNYDITEKGPHYNIRQQITEELNQLDLKNIHLILNRLDVFVDKKPSIKTLKLQLQDYCRNIDIQKFGDGELIAPMEYEFNYRDENIALTTFFYFDKSGKGQRGRTIFSDSFDIGKDETAIKLTRSIEEKKTKYGELRRPFIISVNFPRTIPNPQDIFSMLFPLGEVNNVAGRHYSGFAFNDSPTNTSISALIVSFVVPHNMGNPQIWLFKNPTADLPVDNNLLPFDTYEYKEGKICFYPAQVNISQLLDIPESLGSHRLYP